MLIHKMKFAALTLLFLASAAHGYWIHRLPLQARTRLASNRARLDEPQPAAHVESNRTRPLRGGCSSPAACSTRKASRCRTRR